MILIATCLSFTLEIYTKGVRELRSKAGDKNLRHFFTAGKDVSNYAQIRNRRDHFCFAHTNPTSNKVNDVTETKLLSANIKKSFLWLFQATIFVGGGTSLDTSALLRDIYSFSPSSPSSGWTTLQNLPLGYKEGVVGNTGK